MAATTGAEGIGWRSTLCSLVYHTWRAIETPQTSPTVDRQVPWKTSPTGELPVGRVHQQVVIDAPTTATRMNPTAVTANLLKQVRRCERGLQCVEAHPCGPVFLSVSLPTAMSHAYWRPVEHQAPRRRPGLAPAGLTSIAASGSRRGSSSGMHPPTRHSDVVAPMCPQFATPGVLPPSRQHAPPHPQQREVIHRDNRPHVFRASRYRTEEHP